MAGKGTTYVLRPRTKRPTGATSKQRRTPAGTAGRGSAKRAPARPQRRKRRISSWPIVAGLLVLAAGGFSMWDASGPDFARAKDRAIDYFRMHVHESDPSWLGLFDYMHRRFGVGVKLASGQLAEDVTADMDRSEVFRIYRRIEDPRAAVGKLQINNLPTPIDRLTASALHCDRLPLPRDWIDVLRKASVDGGYSLTRSVLATEWTIENGCRTRADVETLHADQIVRLVTFVQRRHDRRSDLDGVTDMWFEAVAMLYYVGAGDMVRPEWLDEIVSLQNDDGGWSPSPQDKRSDPHATALALWVLLEHLHPDAPRIPWIQPS